MPIAMTESFCSAPPERKPEQVIKGAALEHSLPRRLIDVGNLHVDHEHEPRERKEHEENRVGGSPEPAVRREDC